MTELSVLVLRNAIGVLGERNDSAREDMFRRLWAPHGQFHTVDGVFTGSADVCKHIGDLLHRCPEYDFAATGEINEVAGAALVPWTFGVVGQRCAYTGTDLVVLEGERIALVCRFLHGPVW